MSTKQRQPNANSEETDEDRHRHLPTRLTMREEDRPSGATRIGRHAQPGVRDAATTPDGRTAELVRAKVDRCNEGGSDDDRCYWSKMARRTPIH